MILYCLIKNGVIANVAYFDMPQSAPWVDASKLSDAQLLDFYQANFGADFTLACQGYIYNGFQSSSLGSTYTYPSDDNSQRNLAVAAAVAATAQTGWTRAFWCADENGVWDIREHTAAQIQQVNSDFDAFVQGAQLKLKNLKTSLANATTSQEVLALCW